MGAVSRTKRSHANLSSASQQSNTTFITYSRSCNYHGARRRCAGSAKRPGSRPYHREIQASSQRSGPDARGLQRGKVRHFTRSDPNRFTADAAVTPLFANRLFSRSLLGCSGADWRQFWCWRSGNGKNGAPDTIRTCGLRLRRAAVRLPRLSFSTFFFASHSLAHCSKGWAARQSTCSSHRSCGPSAPIPSFGISKFAANGWFRDTNKNANKADGWSELLLVFSMHRDFPKNTESVT